MQLIELPRDGMIGGSAFFHRRDLLQSTDRQLAEIWGRRVAVSFQDPAAAFHPRLTLQEQFIETTRTHLGMDAKQAQSNAAAWLERMGIPSARGLLRSYPHELPVNVQQRVMLAMALACEPELLIVDDFDPAVDVTVRAELLDLLKDLRTQWGMAILFITRDLSITAGLCHRVLVMLDGRIVEEANCDALFAGPRHPYTRGLLGSVPRLDRPAGQPLTPVPGPRSESVLRAAGCSFQPRCPHCIVRCGEEKPPLAARDQRAAVACFVDMGEIEQQGRRD